MMGKLLGVLTLVAVAVVSLMSLDDGSGRADQSDLASPTPPKSAPPRSDDSPPSTPQPPDAATVAKRRTEAAVDAARAFARPSASTSRQQWWKRVRPTLADGFAREVEYTDPQQVPYTQVTGDASIISADDDVPARVRTIVKIDTDAGAYGVDVADGADGVKVTAIYAWADR